MVEQKTPVKAPAKAAAKPQEKRHKKSAAALKRQKLLKKKSRYAKRYSRQNVERFARVKDTWRTPRGINSDQKKKQKNDGPHPSKSFRKPSSIRGLHPSGYYEVLVGNASQLGALNAEENAVRIIGTVGKRKREEIAREAAKLNLKVLN